MNHSVAHHYVEHLLVGAEHLGFSRATLLAPLARKPDCLTAIARGERLPVDDYVLLMQHVWALTGDETGGYSARALKPGTFAMMCHACIGTANLRKAYERAGRFFTLVSDDIQLSLTENDSEASFIFSQQPPPPAPLSNLFYMETLALIFIRWASWLIDKKLLVARIDFQSSSPGTEAEQEAEAVFGIQPHYGQSRNQVTFASRFLDERVAQTEASLKLFLEQAPASLLSHYRHDASVSAQVRKFLHLAVDQGGTGEEFSLEQVADALHLTSQTLRRRLKEEGNSFQEIKDAVRCRLAIHFLLHDALPAQDIAYKMGFSDPSVFYKAFKRWTGLTPGAYKDSKQSK